MHRQTVASVPAKHRSIDCCAMDYRQIDTCILLKLLKADDEQAFKELYARKWKELYKYCLQKVHQKEVAEELLQNIWVALWNNRHVSSIESLDSYLKTAVKYQVINYIKSSLLREQKLAALPRPLNETTAFADNGIMIKELSAAIESAIAALPGKTGKVFRLSRFENKSVKDISLTMNISEKAVEYHITKSLKLMRVELKEYFLPAMLVLFFLLTI